MAEGRLSSRLLTTFKHTSVMKKTINRLRTKKGFTLIELTMVIVILGILAAVALPKFVDLSAEARTARGKNLAGTLVTASAINYAKMKLSRQANLPLDGFFQAGAGPRSFEEDVLLIMDGWTLLGDPREEFFLSGSLICTNSRSSVEIFDIRRGDTLTTVEVYCYNPSE